MSFTEGKTVENPMLKWLRTPALGWRYENQQQVIKNYRTDPATGVCDEREVLLLPILRRKLRELNPGVITDSDRADRILFQLRKETDNREWLAWLRNEKTFQFAPDEKSLPVKLVHYDHPDENDFLVTNQFWVEGPGGKRRRTDLLLFLNGIPVVNPEAKTTTRDDHIEWREGAKQTGDYLRDVPQLYYSNAFCCGANELKMFYGVPGVPFHKWQQWRDPAPHQLPEFDEMKCGVFGLLDRGNLLEIIRNFIVFEMEEGKLVKKVARYQQFRAANKLLARALRLDKPHGWRRGIVWHTQGSGKSLTILFVARKLWNHPDLNQPTVIIVVDRDQLQDQMVGQFIRTNTENCRVAENKEDLLALLRDGYRGIIVTIMHKFDWRDAVEINRADVIMLVDEAHRTQYGELAIGMRKLLPEASMFGFTGTPLELDDRNTPVAFGQERGKDASGQEVFERYMDRYSIGDALRDRATVPIHWQPRMVDWKVWGKALDEQFERHFAHLTDAERNALKSQEAKLDRILKLPQRIAQIAADVAEHFTKHVQPNKFKAMLVCWDKETCALYKAALDKLLSPEATLCVFSEEPLKDKEIVKQHYLGDATRKKAIDEFKKPKPEKRDELAKPENRFRNIELLMVCNMLLDGAKTRELIRQHVRMDELKKPFPSYELNEEYLTKLPEIPPDAKALDIEAMLAAELKIRLDEDEDYQPLSEQLKRIVRAKRAGTLAGIALIAELEKLAKGVVRLVEQSKLPLREQIARLVFERCPDIKPGQSDDVAEAILAKAKEWCFPEWFLKEDMDTKLYQEFTIMLAGKFGNLGLHGKGKDFVDGCIKLLKKARFTKPTESAKP